MASANESNNNNNNNNNSNNNSSSKAAPAVPAATLTTQPPKEEGFVDLCPDGGVRKRVLKEGLLPANATAAATATATAIAATPPASSQVFVHFIGSYVDDESKTKTVFLDTKEKGSLPFSFQLDKEQTIRGLEIAAASMKESEVAIVECKPDYAFGAFGNPQGFHSMGKPIPANATLTFELQLISFEPPAEKESWQLSDADKIDNAKQKKEAGNELFKALKYEKASLMYHKAIDFLNACDVKDSKERKELLVNSYLNLAACLLKLSQPREVIDVATKALEIDAANTKALFRRGKAYNMVGDCDNAKEDLTKALTHEPNNNDVRQELALAQQKIAAAEKNQKQLFGNMFSKLSTDANQGSGLYEDKEILPGSEPKTKKCTICGEEVDSVQWARHVIKKHSKSTKS